MSRVFTSDQLATLRRQYETGTVIAELAETWGHSGLTIYRALKESGAALRSRGDRYAGEARNAIIQARRYAGEAPAVLCADYGITPGRLAQILALPPIAETTLTRSDLTPDEEERVVAAYEVERMTIAEIAAAWKISRARIDAVLNRRGIPRRNRGARSKAPPPPAPRVAARAARDVEILRRARAGQSRMQIVAEMNLTIGIVYNVLGSLGADELARLYPTPARPGRKVTAPKAKKAARIRPAASPKAPRMASDISPKATPPTQIATRTCHSCNIQIRESEWSRHMADVHKVVSKGQRQLTALERYIAQIQPEAEPERTPEPACDICGAERCPTPLICARHRRARSQHHWTGKKVA